MLFSRAVLDCLMMPVQNKLEEWKKVASALDKDHAKGERVALNIVKFQN